MKKYIRQGRRFVAIPDDPCIVGWYYNDDTKSFTVAQRPSSIGVVVGQTEEEFTICSIITLRPMSFEEAKQWCNTFPKELNPHLPSREEAIALVENEKLYHKLFDVTLQCLETVLPYIWSKSNMKRSPVCKVCLYNATILGYGERTATGLARTKVFLTIKR